MSDLTPSENESLRLPKKSFETASQGSPEVIRPPRQISSANSLEEILAFARKENATDVHITSHNPVYFRRFGHLGAVTTDTLTPKRIQELLLEALPIEVVESFEKTGDTEYVHTIPRFGRFRMTIMKQKMGYDLTVRLIPIEIPRFAATGMPTSCASLIKWSQGIILITGPAGSGKTTTLATLVEMVNQRRHEHIITMEDPIEIVYEPELCQISQRQINVHTLSQGAALRAALREDPDVLVVGELRDMGTLKLAITAAETGHLVFGTMNTVNAVQTISRIVDCFPTDEQQVFRNLISESLRGIICQQLIPRKDGNGLATAYEILINTPSVANHIRKGTFSQIENTIITGKTMGMILMAHSLKQLVTDNIISHEDAQEVAIQIQQ